MGTVGIMSVLMFYVMGTAWRIISCFSSWRKLITWTILLCSYSFSVLQWQQLLCLVLMPSFPIHWQVCHLERKWWGEKVSNMRGESVQYNSWQHVEHVWRAQGKKLDFSILKWYVTFPTAKNTDWLFYVTFSAALLWFQSRDFVSRDKAMISKNCCLRKTLLRAIDLKSLSRLQHQNVRVRMICYTVCPPATELMYVQGMCQLKDAHD